MKNLLIVVGVILLAAYLLPFSLKKTPTEQEQMEEFFKSQQKLQATQSAESKSHARYYQIENNIKELGFSGALQAAETGMSADDYKRAKEMQSLNERSKSNHPVAFAGFDVRDVCLLLSYTEVLA